MVNRRGGAWVVSVTVVSVVVGLVVAAWGEAVLQAVNSTATASRTSPFFMETNSFAMMMESVDSVSIIPGIVRFQTENANP